MASNGRMLVNTATIWRTTLERIEKTQIDAVSKAWLQDAHLASYPHTNTDDIEELPDGEEQALHLMLQVPNHLARDVIKNRWQHSLEELLGDVIGQSVTLSVSNVSEVLIEPEELPQKEHRRINTVPTSEATERG